SHSAVFYLTAAQPNGPGISPTLPDNTADCGYAMFVVHSDRSPPAAIPNSVQNANSATFFNWVGDNAGQQVTVRMPAASVDLEVADGRCTPPHASPSASVSPTPSP